MDLIDKNSKKEKISKKIIKEINLSSYIGIIKTLTNVALIIIILN